MLSFIFVSAVIGLVAMATYFAANNLNKYSKEYDTLLNDLMDQNTAITTSNFTISFETTSFRVWVGNYPYAFGSTYPIDTVYPSMKTRKRLANYIITHKN
jgi:hypothetical protein